MRRFCPLCLLICILLAELAAVPAAAALGEDGQSIDIPLSPASPEVDCLDQPTSAGLTPPDSKENNTTMAEHAADQFTWSHGGIIRGPRSGSRMALIFTGGDFGDGLDTVLNALEKHSIKGSFFFTGDFYRNQSFAEGIKRAVAEGHYLGPHSDEHLLYAPWDDRSKTLVSKEEFTADLEANLVEMDKFGISREEVTWWIPPYEWYNEDISKWSDEFGVNLFNFTPGTVSHTDYMEDDDPRFRSSEEIFQNILSFEEKEKDGLNGFMLLIHQGASPKRTDKFYKRLDDLITELKKRGYSFVRVDELLEDAPPQPGSTE